MVGAREGEGMAVHLAEEATAVVAVAEARGLVRGESW